MNQSWTLLLVGSSIMEQWTDPASLAPSSRWRVVNRALGGTTTAYWAEHLPSVLAEERPRAVLAYMGSNDFAHKVPAATIASRLQECRMHVSNHTLKPLFGYLSIMKAPQRRGSFEGITAANGVAREAIDRDDFWFDTDSVFLAPDGSPRAGFYMEDGLHLSPAGYAAFTRALRPRLSAWLCLSP